MKQKSQDTHEAKSQDTHEILIRAVGILVFLCAFCYGLPGWINSDQIR